MKEFEFKSAGISVVFRGDDLFLSAALLAEFEDRYVGRVSERTLQAMLVVAQNVEAIRYRAGEMGELATFGTITSWASTEALATETNRRVFVWAMSQYRRKLVKLTGACLEWVNEFGRKGGRLHGHFAADRWIDLDFMEEAKILSGALVGRCNIEALGAPGYLWKELGKGVGRRGLGFRLMGALGDFRGRCGMRDFLLDSPMAECRRLAWASRSSAAEGYGETWEKARELFEWWLAGKMWLGEQYDRYRETMVGFDCRKVGDAWEGEDQSLDVGFNVEDFEQ